MSDYSMAYQVACTPGPKAAAGMTRLPNGAPVLVVYLDPVNMTIQSGPNLAGVRGLADFCRELAREAARLAATIDRTARRPRQRPSSLGMRWCVTSSVSPERGIEP